MTLSFQEAHGEGKILDMKDSQGRANTYPIVFLQKDQNKWNLFTERVIKGAVEEDT